MCYNTIKENIKEDKSMAQATFSVRMDKDLKTQFDKLCNEFGMNTSTAINVFARAVVREKKIPFEITSNRIQKDRETAETAFWKMREIAKANGLQEMTLDDINEEIRQSRQERKQKK